jgi:hypothetical protein
VSSLDVDEGERKRVVDAAIAFFARMRAPSGMLSRASRPADTTPAVTPPVESFFDRES